MKLQERFDNSYMPEPNSGCWLWTKTCNYKGYGKLHVGPGKKSMAAHRLSYLLHKGEIPEDKFILHNCDTPCCVNPDHLRAGTQSDNIQEMYDRGRYVPKKFFYFTEEDRTKAQKENKRRHYLKNMKSAAWRKGRADYQREYREKLKENK